MNNYKLFIYYRTDKRGNVLWHMGGRVQTVDGVVVKPLCGVREGEDDHVREGELGDIQCMRCKTLYENMTIDSQRLSWTT